MLRAAEGAGPDALVLVEGQGSICHPGSTATLPLLRGSQPTDLLLVHRAGQTAIRNQPHIPLPPIPQLISALEAMAALARPEEGGAPPARVVAIALNTAHLAADQAAAALEAKAARTGLRRRRLRGPSGVVFRDRARGAQGQQKTTPRRTRGGCCGDRASEGNRTPEWRHHKPLP